MKIKLISNGYFPNFYIVFTEAYIGLNTLKIVFVKINNYKKLILKVSFKTLYLL